MPTIRFLEGPGGQRVAYAVDGPPDGPVLICPAWWISHLEKDWEESSFRRFFSELAREMTVVRYDRAGVGLSDRGDTLPEVSLDTEVTWLEAVVETVGAQKIRLLGISCGGPVAVAYAARHPERVERLALYGSYLDGHTVGPQKVRDAVRQLVKAHWGLGSRALADIFAPELDREGLARFTARQRASSDADTAACLLDLTYETEVRALAGRIVAPTAVIHRRADRAIPFEAGRQLAAAIPGAALVPLEGKNHLPWEGAPDALNALRGFLTGREGEGASLPPACRLSEATRELLVEGGESIPLTRLEFGVMRHFAARPHTVVGRDELLQEVWGDPFRGSNVVDALIRGLRKKLGPWAASIETVTGHGYRFVGFREGERN